MSTKQLSFTLVLEVTEAKQRQSVRKRGILLRKREYPAMTEHHGTRLY